mmetsp:Transcript_1374/g.3027  ORF Transcript_1374/g.3027 Transcript_1374/m.3027 type:complete len:457 (+) Transcript_1374:67-1437(+)
MPNPQDDGKPAATQLTVHSEPKPDNRNSTGPQAPTTNIVTCPQPNDIIMGRGALQTHYKGNKRLRQLVMEHREAYANCNTHKGKQQIVWAIVGTMHAQGGRFLKQIDHRNGGDGDNRCDCAVGDQQQQQHRPLYVVMEDRKVIVDKVKQLLRDVDPATQLKRKLRKRKLYCRDGLHPVIMAASILCPIEKTMKEAPPASIITTGEKKQPQSETLVPAAVPNWTTTPTVPLQSTTAKPSSCSNLAEMCYATNHATTTTCHVPITSQQQQTQASFLTNPLHSQSTITTSNELLPGFVSTTSAISRMLDEHPFRTLYQQPQPQHGYDSQTDLRTLPPNPGQGYYQQQQQPPPQQQQLLISWWPSRDVLPRVYQTYPSDEPVFAPRLDASWTTGWQPRSVGESRFGMMTNHHHHPPRSSGSIRSSSRQDSLLELAYLAELQRRHEQSSKAGKWNDKPFPS